MLVSSRHHEVLAAGFAYVSRKLPARVPGRCAKGTRGEYRKTWARKIGLGALPKPSCNHSELQGERHLLEGCLAFLRYCLLWLGIQGDEEPRSGRHLSRLQSTMMWKMALQTRGSACSLLIYLLMNPTRWIRRKVLWFPMYCVLFYILYILYSIIFIYILSQWSATLKHTDV